MSQIERARRVVCASRYENFIRLRARGRPYFVRSLCSLSTNIQGRLHEPSGPTIDRIASLAAINRVSSICGAPDGPHLDSSEGMLGLSDFRHSRHAIAIG